MTPPPIRISKNRAGELLVEHHQLNCFAYRDKKSAPELLRRSRCIQLDPLNRIGTNADLVALARIENLRHGDIYQSLFPGHAYEHFAKERCLLPPDSLPWYRKRACETPWWRLSERLKRLPPGVVESVLEEVRERGPINGSDLLHRGTVQALDWNGWKGTSSATRMALEVLWTRCEIVVCGRTRNAKLFDIAARALPDWSTRDITGDFGRWALLERVQSAGFLAKGGGPVWSTLREVKRSGIVATLLVEGKIQEIKVDGTPRTYLAPKDFIHERSLKFDDRVRILGPLDPLIWDRALVKAIFDFDYVWEVYKPAAVRRWGWYVCPILYRDQLIGKIDAEIVGDKFVAHKLWREHPAWQDDLVDEALCRHARACGVEKVIRKRALRERL